MTKVNNKKRKAEFSAFPFMETINTSIASINYVSHGIEMLSDFNLPFLTAKKEKRIIPLFFLCETNYFASFIASLDEAEITVLPARSYTP